MMISPEKIKKKIIFEQIKLLEKLKTETTFVVKNGLEPLSYNESRRIDCTNARHPQTNGIYERFHKTILNEFYLITFRQ